MFGDKTSGDKTSVDKTFVGTKHPWGQNIRSKKTSVGQNVLADKTSGGQNVWRTKCLWGQNVCGDKTPVGTKCPWTKRPSGSSLPGPCEAIFTDKNLLSVKEKSANTHTLSVGGWGETRTVLNTEVLYIYQNSLHPKIVIFSRVFL
jgi:hypothetical protein